MPAILCISPLFLESTLRERCCQPNFKDEEMETQTSLIIDPISE